MRRSSGAPAASPAGACLPAKPPDLDAFLSELLAAPRQPQREQQQQQQQQQDRSVGGPAPCEASARPPAKRASSACDDRSRSSCGHGANPARPSKSGRSATEAEGRGERPPQQPPQQQQQQPRQLGRLLPRVQSQSSFYCAARPPAPTLTKAPAPTAPPPAPPPVHPPPTAATPVKAAAAAAAAAPAAAMLASAVPVPGSTAGAGATTAAGIGNAAAAAVPGSSSGAAACSMDAEGPGHTHVEHRAGAATAAAAAAAASAERVGGRASSGADGAGTDGPSHCPGAQRSGRLGWVCPVGPTPRAEFALQQQAFDFLDAHMQRRQPAQRWHRPPGAPPAEQLRVFASELTSDGKRRFIVCTPEALWDERVEPYMAAVAAVGGGGGGGRGAERRPAGAATAAAAAAAGGAGGADSVAAGAAAGGVEPPHLYEIIRQGSACHLYFDLEFSRALNPHADGDAMVQLLLALVAHELQNAFRIAMPHAPLLPPPLQPPQPAPPGAPPGPPAPGSAGPSLLPPPQPLLQLAQLSSPAEALREPYHKQKPHTPQQPQQEEQQPQPPQPEQQPQGQEREQPSPAGVLYGVGDGTSGASCSGSEGQGAGVGVAQAEQVGYARGSSAGEGGRAQQQQQQQQREQQELRLAQQEADVGALALEADRGPAAVSAVEGGDSCAVNGDCGGGSTAMRCVSLAAASVTCCSPPLPQPRNGPCSPNTAEGAAAAAAACTMPQHVPAQDVRHGGAEAVAREAPVAAEPPLSACCRNTSISANDPAAAATRNVPQQNCSWVVELDSTSATKFSRHVLVRVPHCAFKDNFHVSTFVQRLFDRIAAEPARYEPLFVRASDDPTAPRTLFIDPAVYTRNRAFRLYLSSKAGKPAVLRATRRHAAAALLARLPGRCGSGASSMPCVDAAAALLPGGGSVLLPWRTERRIAYDLFLHSLITGVGRVDRLLTMYDDGSDVDNCGAGGGGSSAPRLTAVAVAAAPSTAPAPAAAALPPPLNAGSSPGCTGPPNPQVPCASAAPAASASCAPGFTIPRLPAHPGVAAAASAAAGSRAHGGGGLGRGLYGGAGGGAAAHGGPGSLAGEAFRYGPSPFPEVERFVESMCCEGGVQGHVRCWAHAPASGLLVLPMRGNRWCANVGRQHRSNGVYYTVDLRAGVWWQRCYDPDCRGFRGPLMPLPPHVWAACRPRELPPPPQQVQQQPVQQQQVEQQQAGQQQQQAQRIHPRQGLHSGTHNDDGLHSKDGCKDSGMGDCDSGDAEYDAACIEALARLEQEWAAKGAAV